MAAVLQPELSQSEKAEIRKRVFESEKRDVLKVIDGLNFSHEWHKAFVERDALALLEAMERAFDRCLEKMDVYGREQQEELDAIARNGR